MPPQSLPHAGGLGLLPQPAVGPAATRRRPSRQRARQAWS